MIVRRAGMLTSLPGAPIVDYADEIEMGDNINLVTVTRRLF
jgi:hypothetical protein